MRRLALGLMLGVWMMCPGAVRSQEGAVVDGSGLEGLRQSIAEHRTCVAEVLARMTVVEARADADKAGSYDASVTQATVAVGPGMLFVDALCAPSVDQTDRGPKLVDPEQLCYWHAPDGRAYRIEPAGPAQVGGLAYPARALARVLDAPDAALVEVVGTCLQAALGPADSLPSVVERALAGARGPLGEEVVEALHCLRAGAALGTPGDYRTAWFAPDRGYVMAREESLTSADGVQTARIHRVLEFAEVEGVGWFPSVAETTTYRRALPDGEWRVAAVTHWLSRDTVRLEPNDQLFVPWFPNATLVIGRDGKRDVVGDDDLGLLAAAVDGDLLRAQPTAPSLKGRPAQ